MKSQTTDRYNLTINANHVSLGNAIDDAAEQHFGRNDHDKAHGCGERFSTVNARPTPDSEYLRIRLRYDEYSGRLYWRPRPATDFHGKLPLRDCASWNGKHANRAAGYSSGGYISVRLDGIDYKAHRLIWAMKYGSISTSLTVDHLDGDRANNKICNLRLVPQDVQARNRIAFQRSSTGCSGVFPHGNRFRVSVRFRGKTNNLGVFGTLKEADDVAKEFRAKNGFTDRHGTLSRETESSLHDHWHTLQAFAGARQ